MHHTRSSVSRSRGWRRWIPPLGGAGAGAAALMVWFEEIIVFAADFIGIIFLPILAAPIFLFNHFVFKSVMNRQDDGGAR